MIQVYDSKEKCCGCSACKNICPSNAIKMISDNEGFYYPVIDQGPCIDCGLCRKVCPMINDINCEVDISVYGCKNKDDKEKYQSSSGGVFSILSREIINKGGIVYGAAFNSDFHVKHIGISDINNLDTIRRSKYVQSVTENAYREVKKYLEDGIKILFSGTPCQIAGLRNYIGKNYDNLLLIDIVCHGVPSPAIFKKYLEFNINKYGSEVESINFCSKDISIKALKIDFKNGKSHAKDASEDLYYKAFSNNIMLRPSCYKCKHNNFRSGSDISLADYWGASERFNDYQEKTEGVSLVIIKSQKGKKMFELTKDKFEHVKTNIDHATKGNPNILSSSKMNGKRDMFFEDFRKNMEISKLLTKYTKVKIISKIIPKIKYEIRKLARKQ